MTSPRVTAIVPVYNGARFLAEALDSALAQEYRDFEIVVVDDGSNDESGRIADAYAAANPQHVRVIHQSNQGLPLARNCAIEDSKGEFLALLDADDVWLPHHLAESVAAMDRDLAVGLVHANFEMIDAAGRGLRTDTHRWRDRGSVSPWELIFLRIEHVGCPTAVFRRTLIDQVGAFDPAFNRLGCEDRDLWLRIAAVADVTYLDNVHARYRLHGSNMSSQREKMTRARVLLVDKHSASVPGKGLRHRALAAVYADDGYSLRRAGSFRAALAAYGSALRYNPWSPSLWKATLGAILARR